MAELAEKETQGGYNHLLFLDLPPGLLCGICLEVLRDPHQCAAGHLFCHKCILESLTQQATSIAKNLYVRNHVIDELLVKCPSTMDENQSTPCSWNGKLRDLDHHIENDCPNSLTECPHPECKLQVLRRNMDEHISSCIYRGHTCHLCHKDILFYQLEEHQQECPMRSVPCPNENCNHICRFMDINHHRMECGWEEVPCPLKPLNCCQRACPGTLPRYQLRHHFTLFESNLQLLASAEENQKRISKIYEELNDNKQIIAEFQVKLSLKEREITILAHENESLHQQLRSRRNYNHHQHSTRLERTTSPMTQLLSSNYVAIDSESLVDLSLDVDSVEESDVNKHNMEWQQHDVETGADIVPNEQDDRRQPAIADLEDEDIVEEPVSAGSVSQSLKRRRDSSPASEPTSSVSSDIRNKSATTTTGQYTDNSSRFSSVSVSDSRPKLGWGGLRVSSKLMVAAGTARGQGRLSAANIEIVRNNRVNGNKSGLSVFASAMEAGTSYFGMETRSSSASTSSASENVIPTRESKSRLSSTSSTGVTGIPNEYEKWLDLKLGFNLSTKTLRKEKLIKFLNDTCTSLNSPTWRHPAKEVVIAYDRISDGSLLRHLEPFLLGKSATRTTLFSGGPGIGKTVGVCKIIAQLKNLFPDKNGTVYKVFIIQAEDISQSPDTLYCTLLKILNLKTTTDIKEELVERGGERENNTKSDRVTGFKAPVTSSTAITHLSKSKVPKEKRNSKRIKGLKQEDSNEEEPPEFNPLSLVQDMKPVCSEEESSVPSVAEDQLQREETARQTLIDYLKKMSQLTTSQKRRLEANLATDPSGTTERKGQLILVLEDVDKIRSIITPLVELANSPESCGHLFILGTMTKPPNYFAEFKIRRELYRHNGKSMSLAIMARAPCIFSQEVADVIAYNYVETANLKEMFKEVIEIIKRFEGKVEELFCEANAIIPLSRPFLIGIDDMRELDNDETRQNIRYIDQKISPEASLLLSAVFLHPAGFGVGTGRFTINDLHKLSGNEDAGDIIEELVGTDLLLKISRRGGGSYYRNLYKPTVSVDTLVKCSSVIEKDRQIFLHQIKQRLNADQPLKY